MKHLLTADINGADWGRVVSTGEGENVKVLLKGFDFGFSPYKLVDLGLPSGIKWADRNIGAASPEDAGLYFQWGDTQGYTADQCGTGEGQKAFTDADYKFYKEGATDTYADSVLKLEDKDDAAKVNMGSKYRMPTKADMIELFINTTQKLILSDNTEILPKEGSDFAANGYFDWAQFTLGDRTIKGMKVIGSNGNELFFPASGGLADGSAQFVGAVGYFWSASRYEEDAGGAWYLSFDSGYAGVYGSGRFVGLPVRGVVGGGVA